MAKTQIPISPVKTDTLTISLFFIKTMLWLIPSYFIWYIGAKIFCYPAIFLADILLPYLLPSIIVSLEQVNGGIVDLVTSLEPVASGSKADQLVFEINTLKYAYGFPLLFAMTAATNQSNYEKMDTLTYGFIIIVIVHTWGICFDILATLLLISGEEIASQVIQLLPFYSGDLVINGIALCYQLSALILPAAIPILFWAVRHQSLLKDIILDKAIDASQ